MCSGGVQDVTSQKSTLTSRSKTDSWLCWVTVGRMLVRDKPEVKAQLWMLNSILRSYIKEHGHDLFAETKTYRTIEEMMWELYTEPCSECEGRAEDVHPCGCVVCAACASKHTCAQDPQ